MDLLIKDKALARKKRQNKIVRDVGADPGADAGEALRDGGADAREAQSYSSNAAGADAEVAQTYYSNEGFASVAPLAPADTSQDVAPPVQTEPAQNDDNDEQLAPADPAQGAAGLVHADAPPDAPPPVNAQKVDRPWSYDTRRDPPITQKFGTWGGTRLADGAAWSQSGWSSSDGAAWSQSGWSSDTSGAHPGGIHHRLQQIEERLRRVEARNQHRQGGSASGAADSGSADAGGSHAGVSAYGAVTAAADSDSGDEQRPQWYGTTTLVDDDTLRRAQRCMQRGRHRVGQWFLQDFAGQGDPSSLWDWQNACRDRGMHQFGIRGQHIDKKPGAQFTFWKCGRSCFNSRVACMRCNSFLYITCDNGSGTFSTRDDEEMCQFFLLETLQHPEAIVR